MGELTGRAHVERENQNVLNFVWAILSNPRWQLPDDQLAALMECARLQPMSQPMHYTQFLVGLVRVAASRGRAAVRAYVQEGGTAEVLLARALQLLSLMEARQCSDALMSIGTLQLKFRAGTLGALVGQALADLERTSPNKKAAVNTPKKAVNIRGRLQGISMLFHGLSCAAHLGPAECCAALELPPVRDLAQEFARRVRAPEDYRPWIRMLTACCQLGFNPPVGSQQVPLRVSLLEHLPAMSEEFSLLHTLDMLVALRHVYGMPDRDGFAAELKPYRKYLARLARESQKAIQKDGCALEAWRGTRQNRSVDISGLLSAYANML